MKRGLLNLSFLCHYICMAVAKKINLDKQDAILITLPILPINEINRGY